MATRPRHGDRYVLASTGLRSDQAARVAGDPLCAASLTAARAQVNAGEDVMGFGARHVALSPSTAADGRQLLIGVGRLYDEPFDAAEIALLEAVTTSVGHGLERAWLAADRERQAEREAALARTARSLTASLEDHDVLETLVTEVARGLQADVVAVFEGDRHAGGRLVAGAGIPPDEARESMRMPEALSARATRDGEVRVHQPHETRSPSPDMDGPGLRSGAAAPLRTQSAAGALVVAYRDDRWIEPQDLDLLAAFAELGSLASHNAAHLAAAQRAAALDSLTGCLNHGAFQDRLREEIQRAGRDGRSLGLILVDLNDFKLVNDNFGHLVGDALLHSVADALRRSVRAYDQVARYGGDEFAVLLPNTDARTARRVLERARHAIAHIDLPVEATVSASAGLALWHPGMDADTLIAKADEAMFESKRSRRRRVGDRDDGADTASLAAANRDRHQVGRLNIAAGLAAKLSRLLDERAIVEAVIIGLGSDLGYESSILVGCEDGDDVRVVAIGSPSGGSTTHDQPAQQPESAIVTPALRRCVRERRTVTVSASEEPASTGSEIAVPVCVGGSLWGALAARVPAGSCLDEYDAQVLEALADQLGAALRTARLYAELDETHLGTAAALAAALEAKDHYTADHARSIAELAVAVGRELGLTEDQLRDLRYGAIFHDIGKIAIPDAILNKPGPLTAPEFRVVREHPRVGEEILAPVPFLSTVRRIVRHDHERWDGMGYPDGLSGEDIPLGARIVFVVDAYHAMRSDRPYRSALAEADARRELLAHAGDQFDPRVVRAFLAVLDSRPVSVPSDAGA
jgi:diguanylate cyclase (GGDEF)-like protein